MQRQMMMKALLAVGLSSALHASVVTYNFDADTFVGSGSGNMFTPGTDTVAGLLATFTSNPDAAGFQLTPTTAGFFQNMSGNILSGAAAADTLTIVFNALQSSIALNFATQSFNPNVASLTLNAFNGSNFVGTISNPDAYIAGFFFPEGALTFNGGTFDKVVLSSTDPFSIDNIALTGAAAPDPVVPEPATLWFAGTAFAMLSLRLRRRG